MKTRGLAALLALRSVRHNPLPVLVSALGLAAVLVPLLILYGLKSGIVAGLVEDLRQDPAILSVALLGHRPMSDTDIAAIAEFPETGFVIGSPRSIATRVQMGSEALGLSYVDADWLPTGAGDPLLASSQLVPAADEVVLSEQLAESLQVGIGDRVTATVARGDGEDVVVIPLRVLEILPRSRLRPADADWPISR